MANDNWEPVTWDRTKEGADDSYESAVNNSIASENIKPISRSKQIVKTIKKNIPALCLVGILAVGVAIGVGAEKLNDIHEESTIVSQYIEESGASEALSDAFWRDVVNDRHGYNQFTLAQYVEKSENKDLALFTLYSSLTNYKTNNMDGVVSRVDFNDGKEYESFNEYLVDKGFTKDGQASYDVYENEMNKRIVAEMAIKEFNSNHGAK